jgi:chromosome segregation ATPase
MQARIISAGLILLASIAGGEARADSEADRLREALRGATAQTRALEDQRTTLQAKIADAEREKSAMTAQLNAARARSKELEKAQREAVEEFNQRLEERNQTLEKWKTAYEEAATVARAKDAERARFESEAATFKASTKSCQAKNTELIKASSEILQRYHSLTIGDALLATEPVSGLGRVKAQNFLQDSNDRLLDQKATP